MPWYCTFRSEPSDSTRLYSPRTRSPSRVSWWCLWSPVFLSDTEYSNSYLGYAWNKYSVMGAKSLVLKLLDTIIYSLLVLVVVVVGGSNSLDDYGGGRRRGVVYHSVETVMVVSGVFHSPDGTIGFMERVRALYDITVAGLLLGLVVAGVTVSNRVVVLVFGVGYFLGLSDDLGDGSGSSVVGYGRSGVVGYRSSNGEFGHGSGDRELSDRSMSLVVTHDALGRDSRSRGVVHGGGQETSLGHSHEGAQSYYLKHLKSKD
ncbi:hypothetical protein HW555_013536 [Spodoptera exigua]|uniref:Uncharacterized protein n=1 Tax=Spodoptera exigua TaxID=7107 RepID=A0A835G578_SPOEX|nr:hypothetical protein HW555_013536 [Spodoptera exigua]